MAGRNEEKGVKWYISHNMFIINSFDTYFLHYGKLVLQAIAFFEALLFRLIYSRLNSNIPDPSEGRAEVRWSVTDQSSKPSSTILADKGLLDEGQSPLTNATAPYSHKTRLGGGRCMQMCPIGIENYSLWLMFLEIVNGPTTYSLE